MGENVSVDRLEPVDGGHRSWRILEVGDNDARSRLEGGLARVGIDLAATLRPLAYAPVPEPLSLQ
jgi:hypothetical protein